MNDPSLNTQIAAEAERIQKLRGLTPTDPEPDPEPEHPTEPRTVTAYVWNHDDAAPPAA